MFVLRTADDGNPSANALICRHRNMRRTLSRGGVCSRTRRQSDIEIFSLGRQIIANLTPGRVKLNRKVIVARLWLALQLALISVLAYFVGHRFTSLFHGASANIGALWCAITAITVFSRTRQETWKEGTRQVLGALIGALVSGLYLSVFPFSPLGMGIAIAITVLICETVGLSATTKLAATSVIMIMVISNAYPDLNPELNVALRFSEACIGAGIAMLVTLFSPKPQTAAERND